MISLKEKLNFDNLPKHVAIIMDGNGRWAKSQNKERTFGHKNAIKAVREAISACNEVGIPYLTLYTFSTENWKRSREEVSGIFKLLVKFVKLDFDELNEKNVKVMALGDYGSIPEVAKKSLEKTIAGTAKNTGLQFNIALNYGSRREILRAVNRIIDDVRTGKLEKPVDEELLGRYLYTGDETGNIPDPDLIIRTSGEERLSNFLLWQCAYSEFVFTKTLWPDFTPEEFEGILETFRGRDRRFGGRK